MIIDFDIKTQTYLCKCDICGMKYIADIDDETNICINCLIERFE